MAHETPKYWKQYEKYLAQKLEDDLIQYQVDLCATEDAWEARPWYKKIFTEKWHFFALNAPDKPRLQKSSLVGYYNWDVNIRSAKK